MHDFTNWFETIAALIGFSIGFLTVHLLGFVVPSLVKFISGDINFDPPDGVSDEKWKEVVRHKGRRGGVVLGLMERTLFFIAFWVNTPEIILAWLLFKVGSKWEAWQNSVQIPSKLKNVDDLDFLRARLEWGANVLQRFLVGTLGNILAAFFGIAVGRFAFNLVSEILKALFV